MERRIRRNSGPVAALDGIEPESFWRSVASSQPGNVAVLMRKLAALMRKLAALMMKLAVPKRRLERPILERARRLALEEIGFASSALIPSLVQRPVSFVPTQALCVRRGEYWDLRDIGDTKLLVYCAKHIF